MIVNASSLPINVSGVPNLQDALSDWFATISIGKITKSVVDYQLQESVTNYSVMAVLQPFTTKQLQVKPEGQRAWQKWTLHIKNCELSLCLDDKILIGNKKHRVIQKFEWKDYGYIEYQVIEDYGENLNSEINENISIQESDFEVL